MEYKLKALGAAAIELLMVPLACTSCELIPAIPIHSNRFAGGNANMKVTEEIDIFLAFKANVDSDPLGTISDWESTKVGAPCSWYGRAVRLWYISSIPWNIGMKLMYHTVEF